MNLKDTAKRLPTLLLISGINLVTASYESCGSYVLTSHNPFLNANRSDRLGIYHRLIETTYLEHDIFHLRLQNDFGYSLLYDTILEEWAVYEKLLNETMSETMDPRYHVIKTGCKQAILDDCRTFNFSYFHDLDDVWYHDDTMMLIDRCTGLNQSEGNSWTQGPFTINILILVVLLFVVGLALAITVKVYSRPKVNHAQKIQTVRATSERCRIIDNTLQCTTEQGEKMPLTSPEEIHFQHKRRISNII